MLTLWTQNTPTHYANGYDAQTIFTGNKLLFDIPGNLVLQYMLRISLQKRRMSFDLPTGGSEKQPAAIYYIVTEAGQ